MGRRFSQMVADKDFKLIAPLLFISAAKGGEEMVKGS